MSAHSKNVSHWGQNQHKAPAQLTVTGLYGATQAIISYYEMDDNIPGVYSLWDGDVCHYVGQGKCMKRRMIGFYSNYPGVATQGRILRMGQDMEEELDRKPVEDFNIRKFILLGHPLKNRCHVAKKAFRDLKRRLAEQQEPLQVHPQVG